MATQQQIQLLVDHGDVVISNCPDRNVGRIARVKMEWDPGLQIIILHCTVSFLDDGGNRRSSMRFQPYTVPLKATTDTWVDPDTGAFVDDDFVGKISEYQFFLNLANNSINIFGVIYGVVMARDAQGRFNG